MKKRIFILGFFLLPAFVYAQFEQKVSFNLSVGSFKTFGKEMGKYDYDPMQMPHYKPGIIAETGIQLNLSRRFSVMAGVSVMYAPKWSFMIGDYDYLHYQISDTITEEVLAEGINKLNLFNFCIGIYPKCYLLPVKKWNPYIFAGLNYNFTRAEYTDNYFVDAGKVNYLPSDYTPYSPFLENSSGIGFIPGAGIEYTSSDKFGFTLSAGYSLILLKEENFKSEYLVGNFNAILLQAGIRFSFLKSKDL